MKTNYLILAGLLGLSVGLTACNSVDDGEKQVIATTALPVTATEQLALITRGNGSASATSVSTTVTTAQRYNHTEVNGADYTAKLAVASTTSASIVRGIVNVEMEFDATGRWLSVESETDARGIPHVVLNALTNFPASILTYINNFYPGQEVIEEVNRYFPSGDIRVELLNDQVLRFDANGKLIAGALASGQTNGQANTGTSVSDASVKEFLTTYFPSSSVIYSKADREDGVAVQVYYLSTGHKVSFSATGWYELEGDDDRFLALPSAVLTLLPEAIQAYLSANKLSVYDAKHTTTGGYELDLSNGTDVTFDAKGNVLSMTR